MKNYIAILGGGESGVGAALLAQSKGLDPWVSDIGTLKEKYRNELTRASISFEEGQHTEEKILQADLIIKSPGISFGSPIIKKALEYHLTVIDEIEFAFRFLQGKVIAITGTNGKTTTALLTHHILCHAGLDATIAGNVGESLSRKVMNSNSAWYVIEVSSFQLDGLRSFHPNMAILLNITADHMDRYGHIDNYIQSKLSIINNLNSNDHFIYYSGSQHIVKGLKNRKVDAHVWKVGVDDTSVAYRTDHQMIFNVEQQHLKVNLSETALKGQHNQINMMCAITASMLAGCEPSQITSYLKTFVNAPHRMEHVGTWHHISFFNDSKSSNVDATNNALDSFHGPVIWIAGGIDKGNDYSTLLEKVKRNVKVLICIGIDNTTLKAAFTPHLSSIIETKNINQAVSEAIQHAHHGDTVLLSPACASFDLFLNYEDRGNQFKKAVFQLMNNQTTKTQISHDPTLKL